MCIRLTDPEAERHNYDIYQDFQVKQALQKATDVAFVSTPFRRYTPHIQVISDKAEVITGVSSAHSTMTMDEWVSGLDNGSWRCLEVLYDVDSFRGPIGEAFFNDRAGLICGKALEKAVTTHIQFLDVTCALLRQNLVLKFSVHKHLFKPFTDRMVMCFARTKMCKELLHGDTCTTQVYPTGDLWIRLLNIRKFRIGAFTNNCREEWLRELEVEKERVCMLAWERGLRVPSSGVIHPSNAPPPTDNEVVVVQDPPTPKKATTKKGGKKIVVKVAKG